MTRASATTLAAAPRSSLFDLGNSGSVACQISMCVAVGGFEQDTAHDNSAPLVDILHHGRWTMSTLPLPAGATRGVLSAVACDSASRCVATGRQGDSVTP